MKTQKTAEGEALRFLAHFIAGLFTAWLVQRFLRWFDQTQPNGW